MNKIAINYSKDQAVFMQQVDLQEFITQIFNIVKPVADALTHLTYKGSNFVFTCITNTK
jgi:hypothetical protein